METRDRQNNQISKSSNVNIVWIIGLSLLIFAIRVAFAIGLVSMGMDFGEAWSLSNDKTLALYPVALSALSMVLIVRYFIGWSKK